jgi:hypothetical protein
MSAHDAGNAHQPAEAQVMSIDEAKLAELTMLVPGHARSLAERLGLKRIQPKTLSPLAAKLLAIGLFCKPEKVQ